ncbi:polysaccharide deacetylase family sporulation protein PdaB [Paenibacillus roseipurpureus]|uniref:Polysaccharide deacetylase family sporulation protein PdaB n=1 Tax=Paenibacillus roseopurpureus TaxID=2918901 RepID=A0AA96LT75_9BACL|nr:polysaccharide deacetylase family sporulation protein PdaB [Paenibacillus sp. MBLB1832]WNR44245.1 polysaccharide deacetylase family sporulation protein PdaB [Paenibacillus sp. MBLB1832]
MNYFFVINAKKLKQYLFIALAIIFSAAIIYSEQSNVSVFMNAEPSAIYSVQTDKKVIALTFDISWGETRAEPILKTLKDNGVKNATFFLSSPWSKSHPNIVAQIKSEGYEIGSHGNKFDNYSSLSDEDIRKEITTAHGILTELIGKEPNLIRLPNGDFDKRVLRIADDLGYSVIQWDTDSQDWLNKGVDSIVNRVVNKAHPGDIVLLHASDSSQQTQQALPAIIEQLRSKGYQFVSVSELIKQTEVETTPVEDQAMKQIH